MIRDSKKYILCRYDANTETEDYYSVWFLDDLCFDVKCFLFYKNNVITKNTWPELFDWGFGGYSDKERGEIVIKMFEIEIQN